MNVLEHNKIKKKALFEVRNVGYKAIGRRVPDLLFRPGASGKMGAMNLPEAEHAG